MAFENRRYVIISATQINSVDFAQVLETASETCRYSVDGTKTFVKYDGAQPSSVAAITAKSQEYTHEEILIILSTEEWSLHIQ